MLNDEVREYYEEVEDSYRPSAAKNLIDVGPNDKQYINPKIQVCPECGSKNAEVHNGVRHCCGCGVVLDETPVFSDISNAEGYNPFSKKPRISLPTPLSDKMESLLNGAPLPSEQDEMIIDEVDDVLKEVVSNYEIIKSLRPEMIKNVKLSYSKLYEKGFKRLGAVPYRSDAIRFLARREAMNNKEVRKHHPDNITTWIPEKLVSKNFELFKMYYLAEHDPEKKKREKMYRYVEGTADALLVICSGEFGARQGRDMFLTLLLRGREIIGNEIWRKAIQRGLNFKTGFMACLAIYTIRALEKHDGLKYLKSQKEICKISGIPSTTLNRITRELNML